MLVRNEHNNVPESKSHEVSGETFIEGERSFLGQYLNEAVNETLVGDDGIHNPSLHHVHWGPNAAGGESSRESANEVS